MLPALLLGCKTAELCHLLRAAVAQHAHCQQQCPGQRNELPQLRAVRIAEASGTRQHRRDATQAPVRVQLPGCRAKAAGQ